MAKKQNPRPGIRMHSFFQGKPRSRPGTMREESAVIIRKLIYMYIQKMGLESGKRSWETALMWDVPEEKSGSEDH